MGGVFASRRWLALGLVALSFVVVVGCGDDDAFTLRVDLRTDLRPGIRFDRTVVRVLAAPDASDVGAQTEAVADSEADYIAGVRVGAFSDLPPGSYTIAVSVNLGSATVASRTIEVRVTANTAVNAVITASCAGLTCPGTDDPSAATECVSGRCVAPTCTPENPEACPPEICTDDSGCAAAGDCLAGRCVDGDCFQSPNDALCAEGTFCDASGTCETLPMVRDMGPVGVDGGPPDPPDLGPPRPTIAIETPQAGSCIDLGQAYTDPGEFTYRTTFTGRPNATATQWNDHVSCGDPRVRGGDFPLDATGRHVDTFMSGVLDDCWNIIYGRWEVRAEVDGVMSAPEEVTYYNSACANVSTCAGARSFCSPCRFCGDTEYCYAGLRCEDVPVLAIATPNGPGCVDLGEDHFDPPTLEFTITGRANATSTQFNRQVSCAGSTRSAAATRMLDGTGRVVDGSFTTPGSADCANLALGRWQVDVEVDGERSNVVEVTYYNSNCAGVATCAAARTHCP